MLDLVRFAEVVEGAALVVTGEGSLDEQSLQGKAPIGVARAAARAGVPVVAVAGRSLLDDDDLRRSGIRAAYPLSALEADVRRSRTDAAGLLERVGARIAREWLPPRPAPDGIGRGGGAGVPELTHRLPRPPRADRPGSCRLGVRDGSIVAMNRTATPCRPRRSWTSRTTRC